MHWRLIRQPDHDSCAVFLTSEKKKKRDRYRSFGRQCAKSGGRRVQERREWTARWGLRTWGLAVPVCPRGQGVGGGDGGTQ